MFGRSRRTAVLPAAAVLLALCPLPSARAAAIFDATATVAIGDKFDAGPVKYQISSLNPRPGPDGGTPTTTVDSTAHTVDITVHDADRVSTITLPWPLQTGAIAVGSSANPPVAVQVARNSTITNTTTSCALFYGTLKVSEAEVASDGGVAALSADLSSASCGGSPNWLPAAQIRIGGGALDAVPVAEPEQLDIGPLGGTPITMPVTITNAGTKPWHIRDFAIGDFWGVNAPPVFTIVDGSNTCAGAVLGPSEDCALTLTATAPANFVSEWLVVAGDGAEDLVLPLRMEGHPPIPAPTGVAVVPGRHISRVSWDAPAKDPDDSFRVYDVTGGGRTLVGTALRSARSVDLPISGPRQLALVASDSRKAESPDALVTLPAVSADIVANGPADSPISFGVVASGGAGPGRMPNWRIHLDVPGGSQESYGDGRLRLDPSRTTWLTREVGYGLYLCHDDGGRCAAVPGSADMGQVRDADWLPDGRIAELVGSDDTAAAGLWVMAPDGSGRRRVLTDARGDGWSSLTAAPSGDAVYVFSGDQLLRIRLSDGLQQTVPSTSDLDSFTVRTDGRLVLVHRLDLTRYPGPTRSTLVDPDGSHPQALPLPAGINRAVTFSPDGSRIAFLRLTELLTAEVWVANADGTGARRLSEHQGNWLAVQWVVDDHAIPTVALTGPAFSAAAATMTVDARDTDDPVAGLRRECRLDAGAWTSCAGTWTVTGLSAGTHTAAARVRDTAGLVSATGTRVWVVDRSAPIATLAKLTKHAGAKLTLHWTGHDGGGAGVGYYEIRQRSAATGKAWGAWRTTVLRGTSLKVKLKAKHRYGFEVRARDGVGNVGAWSAARTTAVR
jgi:hypothetical protein